MTSTSPRKPPVPGAALVLAIMACAFGVVLWAALRRSVPHAPVRSPGAAVADNQPTSWPVVHIDINVATEPMLTLLPGIGPGLARRIVSDRETNGPFAGLGDLRRVRGIGPITVERLSELADAGLVSARTSTAAPPASGGERE
jgi:competence protein ComEA